VEAYNGSWWRDVVVSSVEALMAASHTASAHGRYWASPDLVLYPDMKLDGARRTWPMLKCK